MKQLLDADVHIPQGFLGLVDYSSWFLRVWSGSYLNVQMGIEFISASLREQYCNNPQLIQDIVAMLCVILIKNHEDSFIADQAISALDTVSTRIVDTQDISVLPCFSTLLELHTT